MKTVNLQLPLTEDAVKSLGIGDTVYLYGEIAISAGLPMYQRMAACLRTGQPLPMDLDGAALFHMGSFNKKIGGRYKVFYINPTTSTRFGAVMPGIIRSLKLRAVGGKGGLDEDSVQAMKEVGCVYLSFLGGGSASLSEAIREVVDVQWEDLVSHFRLVKLKVEGLRATVGIDAHGNSIYRELHEAALRKMPVILERLGAGSPA